MTLDRVGRLFGMVQDISDGVGFHVGFWLYRIGVGYSTLSSENDASKTHKEENTSYLIMFNFEIAVSLSRIAIIWCL